MHGCKGDFATVKSVLAQESNGALKECCGKAIEKALASSDMENRILLEGSMLSMFENKQMLEALQQKISTMSVADVSELVFEEITKTVLWGGTCEILKSTAVAIGTEGASAVQAAKGAVQGAAKTVAKVLPQAGEAGQMVDAAAGMKIPAAVMREAEKIAQNGGIKADVVTNGGKAGSVAEEASLAETPGLGKNLAKRNAIYRTVEGTGERCRIVRPLSDIEAEVTWAPQKYQEIKQCTNDIAKIARNTGMSEVEVAQIKDHLFCKDHILRDGVMPFRPDPEIAASWDRLYRGDFIKNDIQLLKHEYFESQFEIAYKTDYDTAHKAAQDPVAGKPWYTPNLKE